MCHTKALRCFHSFSHTHNSLQTGRRLLSQWEVFVSLPHSPIRLRPSCQLIGRWEQTVVCVCVSVPPCVPADVPCCMAHLLNVTDHSLFHLITPNPPTDLHLATAPTSHIPLLFCNPVYYPLSSPISTCAPVTPCL